MKQIIKITICILSFLSFMSCFSHLDGKIEERDIQLKLVTDIEKVELFIKPSEEMIQIFPISGIYIFKTPKLRFHTPKILGITLRENVWDIPEYLTIRNDNDVLCVLSCEQIWKLKKDSNGISLIEIKAKKKKNT